MSQEHAQRTIMYFDNLWSNYVKTTREEKELISKLQEELTSGKVSKDVKIYTIKFIIDRLVKKLESWRSWLSIDEVPIVTWLLDDEEVDKVAKTFLEIFIKLSELDIEHTDKIRKKLLEAPDEIKNVIGIFSRLFELYRGYRPCTCERRTEHQQPSVI